MSRAFIREVDDAPPPPPLERTASGAANLVTPRGARLIEETIAGIEAALRAAPAEKDEASLRRDLRYWTARRASARLVPTDPHPRSAAFGTKVTIRRGVLVSDVLIVGEDEAEPAKGRVAWTAPLARALEGAIRGEIVELEAGGRVEEIAVLSVRPGEG